MKQKTLIVSLLIIPILCQAEIIKVYFAGGQSNATSTWATAAKNQILTKDPGAVLVWAQHGGTPLREWYTSYSYGGKVGRQNFYFEDLYNPDSSVKGKLEAVFDTLRDQGHTPVLSGLLWFQGETDQYVPESRNNSGYRNDILAFRDAIKADFFVSNLSLSLAVVYEGSGGPAIQNLQAIRDQQAALGLAPDIFAYETMGQSRSDGVHLTSSAAQMVGIAMAIGLLSEPPMAQINVTLTAAQLTFDNLIPLREYRVMQSFSLTAWEEVHRFTATSGTFSWSETLAPEGFKFYRLEWSN